MKFIQVTQIRSCIGQSESMCKIVKSLGLRGIRSAKVQKDNNCIRGMINKVQHLVEYKFVDSVSSK